MFGLLAIAHCSWWTFLLFWWGKQHSTSSPLRELKEFFYKGETRGLLMVHQKSFLACLQERIPQRLKLAMLSGWKEHSLSLSLSYQSQWHEPIVAFNICQWIAKYLWKEGRKLSPPPLRLHDQLQTTTGLSSLTTPVLPLYQWLHHYRERHQNQACWWHNLDLLTRWCAHINLELIPAKMVEMLVDFCKHPSA